MERISTMEQIEVVLPGAEMAQQVGIAVFKDVANMADVRAAIMSGSLNIAAVKPNVVLNSTKIFVSPPTVTI